jgi:uncharacterized protein YndB with AHSA1/START domain
MPGMRFNIIIQRPPDTIYNLLTDIAGYKVWLPASKLYRETVLMSDYPVRVGMKYLDRGVSNVMRGEITELQPPKYLAFHQKTSSQRSFPGSLDVHIRYILVPRDQGTRVTRIFTLHTQGVLTLALPFLLRATYQENKRILQAMKTYLEARV